MAYPSLMACRHDTRGNITIISALCIVSLLVGMAFAVDGASQLNTKRLMQAALDSASLVGAKALAKGEKSTEEITAAIANSFASNMASGRGDLTCGSPTTSFDEDTGDVSVKAECFFPAMLGGSLTPETIRVSNSATARSIQSKIDVSMVLDVSGSMGGSKLEALKSASKQAANLLLSANEPGDIRVSAVSYATAVNAGKYGRHAFGEDIDLDDESLWWVPGCVSERVGDGAWDDRAPGEDAWVTPAIRCPSSTILPLTGDLDVFEENIDTFVANGGTAGHIGIAWAWYLISPLWEDVWPDESKPRAYDEENGLKVVILMTDGIFNQEYHIPYGSSSEQAEHLCEEMRDAGILIFSVAFQAPSAGQETLRNCAGVASRYYEASTEAELLAAYEDIALLLTVLKLVD